MTARRITTTDLTLDEQEHVRSALHYLRMRMGGWYPLARALHFDETTIIHASRARRSICAAMAFRIARIAKVKIDDLLTGKFPAPGVCPRCGYSPHDKSVITWPKDATRQ